jgi:chlorite dismutase
VSSPQDRQETSDERPKGWSVLHLFAKVGFDTDAKTLRAALEETSSSGHQVITAAMLGHKADLAIMAIGPDPARLRSLQSAVARANCSIGYSYLSLTELSEYSAHLPDSMRQARLYPVLPPAGMSAFCFYPMSKRRSSPDNWYELDYDARAELMKSHGAVGRHFAGRIVQLVTGSTGLDDYEWGVTLFGRELEDLKDCVYTMRFDEASYRYAEFGPFLTGIVGSIDEVFASLGLEGGR